MELKFLTCNKTGTQFIAREVGNPGYEPSEDRYYVLEEIKPHEGFNNLDENEDEEKTMSKHTPGPWIDDTYIGEDPYEDPDAPFVQIGSARWMPSSVDIPAAIEAKANARLIAAAPEMLEALEMMLGILTVAGIAADTEAMQHLQSVIAKAKGDSHE